MTASRRPIASVIAIAAAAIAGGAIAASSINLVAADDDGGSVFTAIEQCRLVDTRPASNVGPQVGPLGAAETVTFTAHGTNGDCTIPSDATALALNVTAVGATEQTFLTIWEGGTNPGTSSLNPAPGQPPTPNGVNTPLSGTGTFDVFNNVGSVNVIIDAVGFYGPHDHDGVYLSISDAEAQYVPRSAFGGEGILVSGVIDDPDGGGSPTVESLTARDGIGASVAAGGADGDGEYVITLTGVPAGLTPAIMLTAVEDQSPGLAGSGPGRSCTLGGGLTVVGSTITIPVGCFGEDDATDGAIMPEDTPFHFLVIG